MTVTALPFSDEALEGEVLPALDVTEACDECGQEFTGPAGGKGSAPMLLGRHRWSVHRIKSDGTRQPGKAAKAADPISVDAHPVAGTIAAAGAAVKGSGPPRAAQLASAFGIGLSELTKGAAKLALRADPVQQQAAKNDAVAGTATAATREEYLTAALSLSRDTAARVMAPAARIFAATDLNKRVGRHIVDNTDLAPAVTELAEWGHAWWTYLATLRGIRRDLAEIRAATEQQQAAGYAAPLPQPVMAPDPAPAAAAAASLDPTLGAGRVATAPHTPQQ